MKKTKSFKNRIISTVVATSMIFGGVLCDASTLSVYATASYNATSRSVYLDGGSTGVYDNSISCSTVSGTNLEDIFFSEIDYIRHSELDSNDATLLILSSDAVGNSNMGILGDNMINITVDSGSTFNVGNMSGIKNFTNNGTVNVNNLTCTTTSSNSGNLNMTGLLTVAGSFNNSGSITAKSAVFQGGVYNTTDTASIYVTESISFKQYPSGSSIGGIIKADDNTIINNPSGVKFTLKVGDNSSIQIDRGAFEGIKASEFYLPIPEVTVNLTDKNGSAISPNSDVYAGTTVNVSATVKVNGTDVTSGASISYEKYDYWTDSWVAWTPVASGENSLADDTEENKVRASVAAKEGSYQRYIAGETDAVGINVIYLPLSSVPKVGNNYATINGTKGNDNWYRSNLTFTAPSGFQIKSYEGGDEYAEKTREFTENDVGNTDYGFYLKRKSDGAETGYVNIETFLPDIDVDNLLFDLEKPVIASTKVDGNSSTVSNGSSIMAEKVEFTISDYFLDKVVTPEKIYTVEESTGGAAGGDVFVDEDDIRGDDRTINLVFEAVEGSPKECSLTGYDEAGNEVSLSFTLTHPNDNEESKETEKVGEYNPSFAKTILTLDDQYYGVDYKPTITSESNGDVLIVYKKKGEADTSFTEKKPTDVGDYIVHAVVAATEQYNESVAEDEFSISYLPAPKDAYTIEGTKGKKEYYVSDVLLKAKDGYQISKILNGTYSNSVVYTDGMKSVCLRRKSDGAMTAPINMDKTLKVDTISPKLSSFGVDQDGKTVDLSKKVYADSLSFDIYDEHLETVTLDGEKQDVKNNIATIKLDADGGQNTFSIVATDEAGNEYNLQVTLLASWMKSNIIPAGSKVKLQSGSVYKLGSGKWKISGDSTIYNGNSDFYVTASGEYTFEKID